MLDWNNRNSWVLLDQSLWVSLDWSSWVWVLPYWSLIRAREISDLIGACGSELGRSQSDLIWSDLIGACGLELGRSVLVD